MDATLWDQINTLLADALDQPEAERDAYLVAHATDPRVLTEARELLAAHVAAEADDALASPFTDAPVPDQVGPWRPTNRLGAGGMGVVYAAERTDASFRQRAALKLVRPGFGADFRDRFLRERRLLAGLDHPGIARLLDGGLTDDGLPYLAMELVEGLPITAYASHHELSIRQRIELFQQACEAVAHAHRHLVVHRDLKPAHMLVSTDEHGAPRVKLLDFGIAKLLDDEDEVPLTKTAGGPMTPQYAAPEQIKGHTVTTATDVYALGVVLYELLTGSRPYDLAGLSPGEAERIVTGVTPTRPSAASSTQTDTRRLRGDLDTVVMKALAKEPERRYASAEAFADDLQRYLEGLPVRARPDTWGYRAAKFTRRHRVAFVAGSLALAAILSGAGTAVWQAREARAEASKAQAVQDFLLEMLAAADPDIDGRDVRVADLLDRAAASLDSALADQPDVQTDAHHRLGKTYFELGLLDEAAEQFERALALQESRHGAQNSLAARIQHDLGTVYTALARFDAADSLYTVALATTRQLEGERSVRTSSLLADIGTLKYNLGDSEAAAEAHRQVLAIEEAMLPPDDIEVVLSLGNLAVALTGLGENEEALELLERQERLYRTAHPDDESGLANTLANLGSVYVELGRYEDAATAQMEAVALFRQDLGNDHPFTAFSLSNLGSTLSILDRADEAVPLLRESVAIYRAASGERHPNVGFPLVNLAKALRDLGQLEEAEAAASEAETLFVEGFGADHPVVERARETLASIAERR